MSAILKWSTKSLKWYSFRPPIITWEIICLLHVNFYTYSFYSISTQGGSGYARNIKFLNIMMQNVTNPIIIDQYYCDQTKPCQEQVTIFQSESKFMESNSLSFLNVWWMIITCLLKFHTGLSCAIKQCFIPKHKRNKCLRSGYQIWLQQSSPMQPNLPAGCDFRATRQRWHHCNMWKC